LRIQAVRAPEAVAARLIDTEIACDCEQPGLEAGALLPRLRSLDDAQEGLLRQVLGSFAVASIRKRNVNNGRGGAAGDPRRTPGRLLVSGQQLLVGAFLRHDNAPWARRST